MADEKQNLETKISSYTSVRRSKDGEILASGEVSLKGEAVIVRNGCGSITAVYHLKDVYVHY